jgi:hypothetical protein
MSRRLVRPQKDICQLCDFAISHKSQFRIPIRPQLRFSTYASSSAKAVKAPARSSKIQDFTSGTTAKSSTPYSVASRPSTTTKHVSPGVLEEELREVRTASDTLLSMNQLPSEQDTATVLKKCKHLAELLVVDPPSVDRKDDAVSALRLLDEPSNTKKISNQKLPSHIQVLVNELSTIACAVVKHPPVFITPEILTIYTDIQFILKKPETFPEVFYLYANKLLPQANYSPIKYTKQNPNKASNAIPSNVAGRALQAAIETKQLVLAMDIIESTYNTTAFRRSKFVRKGLVPVGGLALAPLAAYTVASQLARLQSSMDTEMATKVAFVGILAYVGFTATIGVVAVTTANDQMDRVTWAPGMPLRQRWIREEERAAIDKIAGAWGFREIWRRGEEEGEDWEALREWIGLKGMMLDRTELMEGME